MNLPRTIQMPLPDDTSERAAARELVRQALGESAALDLDAPPNPLQQTPAPARIRPTSGLRHTLARLAYAVETRSPLMLVVGTHGGGKSTAARLFANSTEALYYEVPPQYRAKDVVGDLCTKLGLSVGEGYRLRTDVLIGYLAEHPRPILLDEAQRLKYEALDQLKYIADNARITIVLIGSPWLRQVVQRHTDISSRVQVSVEVEPISAGEFRRTYTGDGYPDAVLNAVHAASDGVMRRAVALLGHLDAALTRHEGRTRADLTPAHVRAAVDVVL